MSGSPASGSAGVRRSRRSRIEGFEALASALVASPLTPRSRRMRRLSRNAKPDQNGKNRRRRPAAPPAARPARAGGLRFFFLAGAAERALRPSRRQAPTAQRRRPAAAAPRRPGRSAHSRRATAPSAPPCAISSSCRLPALRPRRRTQPPSRRPAGPPAAAATGAVSLPPLQSIEPHVIDRMLDAMQAGARREHPAREDALGFLLGGVRLARLLSLQLTWRSCFGMISSTSTKLVVCGASVCGRVLQTRGVTFSEPNWTVSSTATSKLTMRPVVLSRPAKIAVGWRIGSARAAPESARRNGAERQTIT